MLSLSFFSLSLLWPSSTALANRMQHAPLALRKPYN